jgi:hypothetical protein
VARKRGLTQWTAPKDESPLVAGFGHQEIGQMYLPGGRSKKVSALVLPSLPDMSFIGNPRRYL